MFGFLELNTRVYPLIISLEKEGLLDDNMLKMIENLDLRVYKIRGTEPRAELYRKTISKIKVDSDYSEIYQDIKDFIESWMPDPTLRTYLSDRIYGNLAVNYILWEKGFGTKFFRVHEFVVVTYAKY
ncbi:hypothetical protein AKJ41_06255 [candidate division MSBL1 archaeon SCGC-AAA259O05]|uniref:Uncharacterized protein n=1 Tax=candidate division MSBL1 archaeon SCGC-AAA259O05 TaxID=1698271 RepID=A0A133UXK0_9EURY|nr:hypothetical protein AKJ41_06255 [candidate division MSBL1 archaeon SCGC-AAA259O05]